MHACVYNKLTMIDYIEAVAHDVRRWAEIRARRGHAYGKHNLCGWCARASAELHLRLRLAGIASEIRVFDGFVGHAFLYTHGHVVDVTATQFQELRDEPVVILTQDQAADYRFYDHDHSFSTVAGLRAWQEMRGWPACEIARPRMSRGTRL